MPLHRVTLKRTTVETVEILVDTGDPLAIERSIYSGSDEIWTHADNVATWDGEVTDTWFKVDAFIGVGDGKPPILKLKGK